MNAQHTPHGKPQIKRQIEGQYYEAIDGSWWFIHQQHGWTRAGDTRALRFYRALAQAGEGA